VCHGTARSNSGCRGQSSEVSKGTRFIGLTLELSGGAAVRLERNVRRVRHDALERWLVTKVSAEHEQPTTPKLPALKAEDLSQRYGKMLPKRSTASQREAGRNTRYERPTRATD
jgi:hypothetical protein